MRYIIQDVTKSHCPNCNKTVKLLCLNDASEMHNSPAFYICFDCNFVGEIGVGRVEQASKYL